MKVTIQEVVFLFLLKKDVCFNSLKYFNLFLSASDSPKLIGVVKAITNRQNPTMSSELIEMIDKEAQSAAVYLKTLNNLRQSVILSNNNNQLENKSNKEKQKRMMMSDDDYLTDDYGFPITKSWSEYSGGTTRFKRRALLPSKYYDIDLDFDYSW
uniref:Uncharacterized protein n=1 Tax=Parastrongyloides trichosuri TaxID=131310 RepID=A0A0N4ZPI0_PARTI